MKTTVDIPDELFRKTKAHVATRGESLRDFIVRALRASLKKDAREGWRSVFGKATKNATRDLQRVIDEEFSAIESEDWD